VRTAYLALVIAFSSGCSLITVKQDPFPTMEVNADRPPPPPKKPPRVVLTDSAIEIKEKVQFETGKAEIRPESHGLLDEVAKVLKDNAQIQLVHVEGHTDSTGSKGINKRLSKERAESVRAYLVQAGIDTKRLQAFGYGPDRPIADNETDAGREQNRRVEFNIKKQGKKEVVVEDEGEE
jgi:outer membrane protein OmpA-like peptidoglycan-associated protein